TSTRKLNEIRSISLSWFTGDFDGRHYYYHAGGDDGYSTFFIVLPEEKSAVAIMGNNDNFNTFQAVLYLVDIFILHKPAKWTKGIAFDLKNIVLTEGVDSMKSFYIHAKNNLADAYDFKYNGLDEVGYGLLDRGYHEQALEVFLFQVEMEPEHSGWPDSVGDAYIAMENEEKAIEWYEKALAMNPKQGFTKRKLKEIRKK
ncbi:MAG: tetratricopeptide repeat protein, partial [Bacteroidota bacterium]